MWLVSHLFQKLIRCTIQSSEAQGCQLYKTCSMLLICCCQLGLLLLQLLLQGCLLFTLHSQPLAHFLQGSMRLLRGDSPHGLVAEAARFMLCFAAVSCTAQCLRGIIEAIRASISAALAAAQMFALLPPLIPFKTVLCSPQATACSTLKPLCCAAGAGQVAHICLTACFSMSALSVLMHRALGTHPVLVYSLVRLHLGMHTPKQVVKWSVNRDAKLFLSVDLQVESDQTCSAGKLATFCTLPLIFSSLSCSCCF